MNDLIIFGGKHVVPHPCLLTALRAVHYFSTYSAKPQPMNIKSLMQQDVCCYPDGITIQKNPSLSQLAYSSITS